MTKTAVVTGANRGIGWGVAQELAKEGYTLALLGRKLDSLEEKVRILTEKGVTAIAHPLDLSDPASIERAGAFLRERFNDGLDLLVNNAGVFSEGQEPYDPIKVSSTVQVNALGPLQLSVLLKPLLARKKGIVVNVSSGMGGLKEMNAGYPGYRISKTALNAVTRYLSQEWLQEGIRVNSVCPGWVKTDMGGPQAERTIEEGVRSVLWAARIPEDGPTGGFFRDGKALDW